MIDIHVYVFTIMFNLLIIYLLFFFFFSSRRRHTRSKRDWSSDVCSSDLVAVREPAAVEPSREEAAVQQSGAASEAASAPNRSEERRVGKECRSRWSADH